MPNWVVNRLNFDCTDEEFEEIITRFWSVDEWNEGFLDFGKIVPMPDYMHKWYYGDEVTPPDISDETDDWQEEHWGTSWNSAYGSYNKDNYRIQFESAWCAPFPVIQRLAELTRLTFTHEYAEDAYQHMAMGRDSYVNGELADEDYFDENTDEPYLLWMDLWQTPDEFVKVNGKWYLWEDLTDELIEEMYEERERQNEMTTQT